MNKSSLILLIAVKFLRLFSKAFRQFTANSEMMNLFRTDKELRAESNIKETAYSKPILQE